MSKEGFIRGRVSFGALEEYRVLLECGEETAAEPSGVLRAYGELPTVGDWVQVRRASEFCLIEEVEARRTAFIRRAAGRLHASQCVAANIVTVAPKNGAIMAGRKGPAMWLRYGPLPAQLRQI